MSAKFDWKLSGPMFARGVVGKASARALKDLGMVGQKLVVDQYYPGHGFRTGTLRRSVSYRVTGNKVTIESGGRDKSQAVNYSEKIERRYGMYRFAKEELEQKAPEIIENVMAGQFNGTSVKALSGFRR